MSCRLSVHRHVATRRDTYGHPTVTNSVTNVKAQEIAATLREAATVVAGVWGKADLAQRLDQIARRAEARTFEPSFELLAAAPEVASLAEKLGVPADGNWHIVQIHVMRERETVVDRVSYQRAPAEKPPQRPRPERR